MEKLKARLSCILIMGLIIAMSIPAYASEKPEVQAETYILMEQETGKILYALDENKKMYPASMTKILTTILCIENIGLDEIVIAGKEVGAIPGDSSKAGHVEGEAITGENLLRGLIIPSGNETACIVAIEIARRKTGDNSISYPDAEKYFATLMNAKAKELGALNSNFVNPHGYHNDNQYSTAYDMAMITREAMKYDTIKNISMEILYEGPSTGSNTEAGLKSVIHKWGSHNFLIDQTSPYYYPYATGLKTGFYSKAGECLAATATKDGINLIAVMYNAPNPESKAPARWDNAKNLFTYGFDHFAVRTIQTKNTVLGSVAIQSPRLGDEPMLSYSSVDDVTEFMSDAELSRVNKDITFTAELRAVPDAQKPETANQIMLKTPIVKGDVIGKIAYSIDGQVLYSGDIVAERDVEARTFNTDVNYYYQSAKQAAFSTKAIPYWVGGGVIIFFIIFIIIKTNRGRKKSKSRYALRKRY